MAEPSETQSAYSLECSMRDKWLETVEADERTALLEKMVKHGQSTGDVTNEVKR